MKNIWRRSKPLDMSDANIGIDDMLTKDEQNLLEYFRALPESEKKEIMAVVYHKKYYEMLDKKNADARRSHADAYNKNAGGE